MANRPKPDPVRSKTLRDAVLEEYKAVAAQRWKQPFNVFVWQTRRFADAMLYNDLPSIFRTTGNVTG